MWQTVTDHRDCPRGFAVVDAAGDIDSCHDDRTSADDRVADLVAADRDRVARLLDELTPPTDRVDIDRWLAEHEQRIAAKVRRWWAAHARTAIDKYAMTVTAAGDPATFDGVTAEWGRYVDEVLTVDVAAMHLAGSLTAWVQSPNTDGFDIARSQRWAAVVNARAVLYERTASNRLRGAGESLWRAIRVEVEDALADGADNETLKSTIEHVAGMSEQRADTIARTETVAAYNAGDFDGAVALGDDGPTEKSWMAAVDARTRPSHIEADGQTVPFDQPFTVGGIQMDRPHASGAPASEVVNCRCVLALLYDGDTRPDGTIVGQEPAAAEPVVSSTRERFFDETTGTWDADRVAAVHDPYVAGVLADGRRYDDPRITFMGGGPASGKGSIGDKVNLRDGTVHIDPDEAKKVIPEYRKMTDAGDANAATFVHEESSYLAKRAVTESTSAGYDTLLDGTGDSSYEKLAGKVRSARENGMTRVVGEYVTVDTDEAVRRAMKRAERTGRMVPETVIRETHASVSRVFPRAAADDLFDELRLWDNNGTTPVLVFERVDGVETIYDAARYDSFLRKNPDFTPPLPAGVVPSQAVTYASAAAEREFASTIARLDELHTLPDDGMQRTAIVFGSTARSKGGHFSPAQRETAKPRRKRGESSESFMRRRDAWRSADARPEIRINRTPEFGDGSEHVHLLHEFGHRTDWSHADAPMIGRVGYLTDTRAAIDDSVRGALRAFADVVEPTLRAKSSLAYQRTKSLAYNAYLRDPREVWARAYAQWAANRLGGKYRDAFERFRDAAPWMQWDDDEFDAISAAVERILEVRGLIR